MRFVKWYRENEIFEQKSKEFRFLVENSGYWVKLNLVKLFRTNQLTQCEMCACGVFVANSSQKAVSSKYMFEMMKYGKPQAFCLSHTHKNGRITPNDRCLAFFKWNRNCCSRWNGQYHWRWQKRFIAMPKAHIYLHWIRTISTTKQRACSHSHKSTTSARYNSSINGIYCVSFVDL